MRSNDMASSLHISLYCIIGKISILMFGQEYAYIFYWIYLVTGQANLCPFNKVDLRQYMY